MCESVADGLKERLPMAELQFCEFLEFVLVTQALCPIP